ncbi:gp62 clamp loader subunit [Acinetobacter phage Ac42]|uniref:gp62 clamp loader subunit n=1 Tax=Acinetobacter phage Ac42 TaxID=762660 RepID=UPI0001EBCCFC|nr:gp62 clamp loader subunit [Acinetobacter phage Ac42]ADI96336.1 gp62 clamp loader subunit [Acinetobacter phage Ac42]
MSLDFLMGDDVGPALNEYQIAWFNQDWDEVKRLTDTFDDSKPNPLFDSLNNINTGKQHKVAPDGYSKFMIDDMLSQHVDSLQAAYMANLTMGGMPDQVHYQYMIDSVPYGKRFTKSSKLGIDYVEEFYLAVIGKRFNISRVESIMYKQILTAKGTLSDVVKTAGFVSDDFLKTITKNVKEIKELKKLL